MEMTWSKAIKTVLREAECSMHYTDIADRIVRDGLRRNIGATPARTVSANLTTSITKYGGKSPFQKVGRGEYILREGHSTTKSRSQPKKSRDTKDDKDMSESQYDIVTSFGMFWRRDYIHWSTSPKLLGVQQIGSEQVDFNTQSGIYLLYDGREIIYVGRSTDRPLGRRLYEHTLDRLSTRWDRFSWFGLLPVSDKGFFGKLPDNYLATKMIPALEAILIEALEPRQNRKRGDDLSAVEYQQKEDPALDRSRKRALLESAIANV